MSEAITPIPSADLLREFCEEFMRRHPVLARFGPLGAVVLHGSVAMGIKDGFADLDVWLLLPAASVQEFDAVSSSRFIAFNRQGREGHFNIVPIEQFRQRMQQCDMPLIFELRRAIILRDKADAALDLITRARREMPPHMRSALVRYHYVEFRSDHRSADNPIERGDAAALLQGITLAIGNALRCAMVIDSEPYPYTKWLHRAAQATPTGTLIALKVNEIIDQLGAGHLRTAGPESSHPISLKLREIRAILIDKARHLGIEDDLLSHWYLHVVPVHQAMKGLRWQ